MTNIFEEEPFQLTDLDEDDQLFAVQTPYRVGMFISLSDTAGGDTADEEELKALEIIVTSYAQDFCKSEFVQQVMNKTVAWKDKWPEWLDNIQNVPEECSQLIDILESHLYDKEIDAFKYNLYEIGRSGALAYRENKKKLTGLHFMMKKLKFMTHKRDCAKMGQEPLNWQEFLNVSAAEHVALKKLAAALNLKKR